MLINHIVQGDVLVAIKTLAPETINCIITSTPYFGLRNYNLPPTNWPEVTYAPMPGLPEITIPVMTCCLGLEDSIEAYVGHMVLVFRELWRVLRDDGTAWLNLGDSYGSGNSGQMIRAHSGDFRNPIESNQSSTKSNPGKKPIKGMEKQLLGIPWRVAFALQSDGWYLRSDIIWAKKNCMPESVTDRPTKAHEYLFLLAKSERYYYDQDAIKEPLADSSIQRINQPNFDNQTGGPKDYRNGTNTNRSARNTVENLKKSGNQVRNKRTVWSIASKPYKGAHFAVMPETLVEPCLLAGCPAQVCGECGEPWVRVVEIIGYDKQRWKPGEDQYHTQAKGKHGATSSFTTGLVAQKKTTHFTPTCQCSAPTLPGVVLDPFFGSGTVGVVAKKNKRSFIGIELNRDYIELAQNRIDQVQPPLFVDN